MPFHGPISPGQFYARIFGTQAAREGAVIRRQIRDVERFVGREEFLAKMQHRGFPVLENAGQFVVFCNNEPIRRLV